MNRLESGRLALVALLAVSQPLLRAETGVPETLRFGVEALVASPSGDLKDMSAKTAMGLALFAEQPFAGGSVIQTRISYLQHPEAKGLQLAKSFAFLPPAPRSLSANAAAIGVEIRQYVDYRQGLFVLGGLAAARYELRTTYHGTAVDQNGIAIPGLYEAKYKTSTKVGLTLGLGYDFQGAVALTLRYATMPMDGSAFSTLQGGLSYRF